MNTSQPHIENPDDSKSPEKLEQEVNQTRARIGERLETLSNRLSPGELLDQVLGLAREHGGEFTRNLGSQIKNNPVPLVITGVGMSWLMLASNHRDYRYRYASDYYPDDAEAPRYTDGYTEYPYTAETYDREAYARTTDSDEPGLLHKAKDAIGKVGDDAQDLKDRVGEEAHNLKDGALHLKDAAEARMRQASARARRNMQYARRDMRSAQECLTDFLQEQPVLAASLGVALGAAIGALLPATEVEDKLMGSARDEALDKTQSLATDQYGKVRATAKKVAENVRQQVQGNPDEQTIGATNPDSATPSSNQAS